MDGARLEPAIQGALLPRGIRNIYLIKYTFRQAGDGEETISNLYFTHCYKKWLSPFFFFFFFYFYML